MSRSMFGGIMMQACRRRTVGALPVTALLGVAFLLVSTSASGAMAASPGTGVAWHGYDAHVAEQPDPGSYVSLISAGGANTFRDDFPWVSIEPERGSFDWSSTDAIVKQAARHDLHVLMIADTTPAWASGASTSQKDWYWLPPASPSSYGTFVAQLAERYGNGGTFWAANPTLPVVLPAGIELWNEENTSGFWGDHTPSPTVYAQMVKAAYAAVKRADPSMTVLLGGLAPAGGYDDVRCTGKHGSGHDAKAWNPVNYLQALYADGAGGSFDAVGWHPYNFWSGATAKQMLAYNLCSAWSQMASTPVSARSLMIANGDSSKPVWVTETGVPTCVTGASYTCVSTSAQATLAKKEVQLWRGYPWAGGFYWYDIRDDFGGTSTTNIEAHFGAVMADNHPKPVYHALQTAWSG
jgi:polysaccharide biosynthesis protein PslG